MHIGGNPPSNPMAVGGSMGNVGQPPMPAAPGGMSAGMQPVSNPWSNPLSIGVSGPAQAPGGGVISAPPMSPATMNVNQGMPPMQQPAPMQRPPMPIQQPMVQQLSRALAPQMANRFARPF